MPEEIFETLQPIQPVESKSSDWPKIVLAAVLGFGLLAGAAYTGYYYGTQQVQQPEKPTPIASQPTPKPTPTPEATPSHTPTVENETKDWKTYTYPSKTGESYEIKYPQDWSYVESSGVGAAGVEFRKDQYSEAYVYVLRRGNADQMSLDQWLEHDKRVESTTTVSGIIVSGIDSILVTDAESGERDVYLAYGNYIFTISETLMGKDAEETKTVFDAMLSTFRFID